MSTAYFDLINVVSFSDLRFKRVTTLPESDLCIQSEDHIFQFKHKEQENLIEVTPGIYSFIYESGTLKLTPTKLRQQNLLSTIDNTTKICNEANLFFSKLHIYDQYNLVKKRGVLLYSQPGLGKTCAIVKFCLEQIEADSGTVVMVWPSGYVSAADIRTLLTKSLKYNEQCTKLIFIIEDIGGKPHEGNEASRSVDSDLLELLDGVEETFKIPSFIIATTNFPQNLLSCLADRPKRFDAFIELLPPSKQEQVQLAEFFLKRSLTEEEKSVFDKKEISEFSIAHIEEMIIRTFLYDKTLLEASKELINQRNNFKNNYSKQSVCGLGSYQVD